ncbi:hypothetical protein MPSEU_000076200 [Mayamaea pseudoterrestris]|nr:hypothetical protein MPSEU_000076200 [Mayamaea pseudoterrestris]
MATSSVPSKRNNNFVAESDYLAALAAIDARFDTTRIRPVVEDPRVAWALINAAKQSLPANLARVVQVVSDEAYHVYKHQMSGGNKSRENSIDKELPATDAAASHDFRFDESELIDPDTLTKVQALRKQVREQSAAVTVLRASVLDRSVRLAERQVHLWQQQYPVDTSSNDDESKSEHVGDADTAVYHEAVQEMASNLQTMLVALEETMAHVPKSIASLQETTLAIQQNQKLDAKGALQPKATNVQEATNIDTDPESMFLNGLVR